MKLLLDTHVWLWSLLSPDRISAKTLGVLASPDANTHLSAISCWEVMLLEEKGRLALGPNAVSWIRQSLNGSSVFEIPVSIEIAMASRQIFLPHQDPADRFIAASSRILGLTLVTSDRALLDCPNLKTLQA
ncbi:MAG: type II toxin-antitoxin system VapC family toxin [Halieaceae bacterium]|nr:type II toxin-antitoxin system VapC family toxin [Halieaceae bacterium]